MSRDQYIQAILKALVSIVQDPSAPASVRVDAGKIILDHRQDLPLNITERDE